MNIYIDFLSFIFIVCVLLLCKLTLCSGRRQNEDSAPLMPKPAIGDDPTGLSTEQGMFSSAPHKVVSQ
jgi:hypothetical protein